MSDLAMAAYLANELTRIVEERNRPEASPDDEPKGAESIDGAVVEAMGLDHAALEVLLNEIEAESEKARELLGALMP